MAGSADVNTRRVQPRQRKLDKVLCDTDAAHGNVMCVDCGGGTVDIVVHARGGDGGAESGLSLREVAKGTGDIGGGTHLDAQFWKHLSETISVFDEYATKHPREVRAPGK